MSLSRRTKTIVASIGFLSDAYDLFILDVVKNVMSELYPQSVAQASAISTAALVGAVLGQIFFGALADYMGRRAAFIVTLSLVLFGCFGSATSMSGSSSGVGIYTQLAIWRFILGFGVGGEYPLSATITSEDNLPKNRGFALAAVFSMQGVGKILAAAVNAVCLSADIPLDAVWRIALAFGGVPGLLTIYHRWQLEESHIWTKHNVKHLVNKVSHQAAAFQQQQQQEQEQKQKYDEEEDETDTKQMFAHSSSSSSSSSKGNTYNHSHQELMVTIPRIYDHKTESDATFDVSSPSSSSSVTPTSSASSTATSSSPSSLLGSTLSSSSSSPSSPHSSLFAPLWFSFPEPVRNTLSAIYEHRYTLAGTAGNWFLLDITFYGQGLFSGTVLAIAGITSSSDGHHSRSELQDIANGSLMLVAIAMPGYLVGMALIERMGRRNMQLMGFCMCTILFVILGAGLFYLRETSGGALFVVLYGLTFFFSNFGANLTTFIIPGEAFPTKVRATCHGLSAASGKLGAVLGSSGMAPLLTIYGSDAASKDRGLKIVMYVCAAVSFVGLLWTYIFTRETGYRDLSELDAQGDISNTTCVSSESGSEEEEEEKDGSKTSAESRRDATARVTVTSSSSSSSSSSSPVPNGSTPPPHHSSSHGTLLQSVTKSKQNRGSSYGTLA